MVAGYTRRRMVARVRSDPSGSEELARSQAEVERLRGLLIDPKPHALTLRLLLAAAGSCLAACLVVGLATASASAARIWLAPANLSVVGKAAESPQVAVDAQGNATAVWRRWDGDELIVETATRPVGGRWSAPVRLAADVGNAEESPQVAVDPLGNVTAMWEARDGRGFVIQSAARPLGGVWSSPVTFANVGGSRSDPRLAVDSVGNTSAIWLQHLGERSVVQGATRPLGGVWSSPVNLSAASQGAFFPQVAVSPRGDATAVWELEGQRESTIQSATRPAGGVWSPPFDISVKGESAHQPQVAIDPQGTATAVWQQYHRRGSLIQSAMHTVGGSWSDPVNLSKPGRHAQGAQVAVDPQGKATVVWVRSDGRDLIVQSAVRPAGRQWSAPVDLSGGNGRGGGDPRVVVDPRGTATAAWRGYDSNRRTFMIESASRTVGGKWSVPTSVSGKRQGENVHDPQLAVDPLGNATAVWWLDPKGRGWIVQAATSVSGRAFASRVVRVRGGRASIKMRCGQKARCGGGVKLKVGGNPIAAKRFGIAKGEGKVVSVKLYRRGLRLFANGTPLQRARLVGHGVKNRKVLLRK